MLDLRAGSVLVRGIVTLFGTKTFRRGKRERMENAKARTPGIRGGIVERNERKNLRWKIGFLVLIVGFLVLSCSGSASAATCGGATTCDCGDTVVSDYTLEDDLRCSNIGLIVGADGIHVDGNGHTITGTGGEFSVGIENNGYDYVTISNLTISGFETGIRLYNVANYNTIEDNSMGSTYCGIDLADSQHTKIGLNYIHNNYDGIHVSGGSSNIIRRNTISSNTHYGIHVGYTAGTTNNEISSNAVCGNVEGDIVVSSSTGNDGDNFCDTLNAGGNSITCSKSCDERGCVADAHPTTIFKCGNTITESCTFNFDLYCGASDGLVVGADSITINGDGYRLTNYFTPPGWHPSGIKNNGHDNSTVKDLTVKNFYYGIYLYNHADDNTIEGCTIEDATYGVYISSSNNNQLLRIYKKRPPLPPIIKYNYIVNNGKGIYLSNAHDNSISDSYIIDNRVEGILVSLSDGTIIEDSYINDNGYDGIYISISDDNRIEDNIIKNNNEDGIYIRYSSKNNSIRDNQITQNKIHGVYLYSCSDNTITDNTVNLNNDKGIYLNSSSGNDITNNEVSSNEKHGIYLRSSSGNTLTDNRVNLNSGGVVLHSSSDNTIANNDASSNSGYHGIEIYNSSYNDLINNTANLNENRGISLASSSNNNNVINNTANSNKNRGIYVYDSNNTLIQDNDISKNDHYGIYISKASNNSIINNTINDNEGRGIYLSSALYNLIYANKITKNTYGIYVYLSARNTTIVENYVCNNTEDDIRNLGSGTMGGFNYCDSVSEWNDRGSSDGCMYSCGELNCTDNDGDGYYLYDILQCPIGNDCNDNDASINPGADEIYCNGRDEDCNARDECYCGDSDDDGAPALTDTCPLGFDCDDTNPTRYPGAREINCNGIDEDCDGEDQCDCTDNDGDGYAIEGGDCGLVDCNDNDVNIHPNAAEIYCNGVDEDCSGRDNCNCIDNDGDGYYLRNAYYCPTGTDCDDERDYIHPGIDEICYNYIDENCNGMINEGCNITCAIDADCSDGRICAEDNRCRCPHGELEFLVDAYVITVCDPVGVPVDTPCRGGWPNHYGTIVTYNEAVPACDLFEVTGTYDLFPNALKARDCCVDYFENGVISPGCHAYTDNAYAQSGLATALNYDNLRRCIGLYELYGNGGERTYMQDYYYEELNCGLDYADFRFGCLGEAWNEDCCRLSHQGWCRHGPISCYDGVHPNTVFLSCKQEVGTPLGWASDLVLSLNGCCFSDLPAHASLSSFLSTGTCVDYSVVLTTLLRMSGYTYDEVYSARSDCPGDAGHAFNLIRFPGDSKYTLVDTVGNCNGYHPMSLPGCNGCYYWEYENCANDNGRVDCPAKSDVWGCGGVEGSSFRRGGAHGGATPGSSTSTATVPPNPTFNTTSAAEGNITVTRTVFDEIHSGEIVRVNITVENDNDYAINVTVRDKIAGAILFGDLNIPEIPAGVIAPPMPYVEFSDTVPTHGEKSFTYSLLPEFVSSYIHSATEIRTDDGLIYLSTQITEVNCVSDGVCDGGAGENYMTCPQDCLSGAEDGICNPITDGLCDNDCAVELDPDCQVEAYGVFDTGPGTYPGIMGRHNGTIKPSHDVSAHKMYTYPSLGTGGHTEYVRIYNESGTVAEGYWDGYQGDYHNITLTPLITLLKDHEYNYTLITGSYPQIHHTDRLETDDGVITCDKFVDANGMVYTDWLPAIRLE